MKLGCATFESGNYRLSHQAGSFFSAFDIAIYQDLQSSSPGFTLRSTLTLYADEETNA